MLGKCMSKCMSKCMRIITSISGESWPRPLAASCLLGAIGLLSACSIMPSVPIPGLDYIAGEEGLLRDRQADYLEAPVLPPTRIPPEYDSYIIDDLMVIPQISETNTQAFLNAPRPRPFNGRSERGVIIQRLGEDSWIVVDVSPSEVWPRIRDYWTRQGINVAFENPTRGVMDTGWFILEGNVLSKEKIRVTVEPGFQNNSAEIRLLHLGIAQSLPELDQVNWPESSTDPDVAFDFLTDMSTYFADVADLYQASTVSFLAENIDSRGKASLVNTPAGREVLHLEAEYSRSWAAIDRALERTGVETIAQDIDSGFFEVAYKMSTGLREEEPGFFKRVVTLNGVFSRKETEPSYPLRILVIDLDGEVDVIVESLNENVEADSEEMRDAVDSLLRLIRNNIA